MEDTVKQNSNIIIDFFKAWFYIIVYAFRGIKFLIMDIWVLLFDNLIFSAKKVKISITSEEDSEEMYNKTKITKTKKQRIYHYSKSQMAKYEKMKQSLLLDLQASGASRSKKPNIYRYTVKNPVNGKIFSDTMSGF